MLFTMYFCWFLQRKSDQGCVREWPFSVLCGVHAVCYLVWSALCAFLCFCRSLIQPSHQPVTLSLLFIHAMHSTLLSSHRSTQQSRQPQQQEAAASGNLEAAHGSGGTAWRRCHHHLSNNNNRNRMFPMQVHTEETAPEALRVPVLCRPQQTPLRRACPCCRESHHPPGKTALLPCCRACTQTRKGLLPAAHLRQQPTRRPAAFSERGVGLQREGVRGGLRHEQPLVRAGALLRCSLCGARKGARPGWAPRRLLLQLLLLPAPAMPPLRARVHACPTLQLKAAGCGCDVWPCGPMWLPCDVAEAPLAH